MDVWVCRWRTTLPNPPTHPLFQTQPPNTEPQQQQTVSASAIPDGWMGLDNGPESTKMIQAELADCKTIIWNGPMGVFEFDKFAAGALLCLTCYPNPLPCSFPPSSHISRTQTNQQKHRHLRHRLDAGRADGQGRHHHCGRR